MLGDGRGGYSPSDVRIVEAISRFRAGGYDERIGFTVYDTLRYKRAMEELVARGGRGADGAARRRDGARPRRRADRGRRRAAPGPDRGAAHQAAGRRARAPPRGAARGPVAEARGDRGAAVVTGASSGIGRATALHLDSLGFTVFAGVRKRADAESLRAAGVERLEPLTIDVTDEASIAAAAREVAERVGESGLAALVNNAGHRRRRAGRGCCRSTTCAASSRSTWSGRSRSRRRCSGCCARRGQDRLHELGRRAARDPLHRAPYHMSKWGVEALADALRLELRPWGIDGRGDRARQHRDGDVGQGRGRGRRG